MIRCVCGHPRTAHRPVAMSVALRGRGVYPVLGSLANVSRDHPRATYIRDDCGCGCGEFLPDT